MDIASIGERLRTVRRQRGMTQKAAASLLGISAETLSRHERGVHNPRKAGGLGGYARIYNQFLEALDPQALPFDLGLPVPTQRLPGTLIDVIADRGAPAPKDHVGLALDPSGRIVWLDGLKGRRGRYDLIEDIRLIRTRGS